jgi:hypothetical protein
MGALLHGKWYFRKVFVMHIWCAQFDAAYHEMQGWRLALRARPELGQDLHCW